MRSKAPAKPRTGKTIRQEGRSRTFTGCGTCRSRHLKCDEAKPTCSCCRRLNLPCQGYAPQLLWLSAPQSEGDAAEKKSEVGSFRYPLFTEAHRSSMSLSMVLSLGHQSAGDALLDLDCESIADQELHTVGPFGVFRALQDSSIQEPSSSPPSPDDEEDMRDISLDLNEVYCLPAFPDDALEDPLQDHSSSSVVADLAGSENWMAVDVDLGLSWDWDDISQNVLPDACNMDLGAPHVGSPRNTSFEGIPTTKTLKEPPRQLELDIPSSGLKSPRISSDDYDDASSMLGRTTFSPNSLFAGSTSILPAHSTVLLRYLKTEVLETTTSTLSRGMSPWRLLLLPCALETFAEISLWNTTSYARRSIFSTLLAKSAFHLSKSVSRGESAASFWLKIGIYHQHAAQDHLKSALKTKFKGDVKYTEMLMAILSVGVVSVYYHGAKAVRKLLLDAESLIRSHGLPATRTFQHRVLHHMYTHLRVILESTNVASKLIEPENGQETRPASQLTECVAPRNFSINAQNLGDLDLTRQKPESVGYSDIHLDVSGEWQATLYPEMFGVPETLMTLLSQTISLANEKPCLEAAGVFDPAISVALSVHIRTLEQQIWSWSLQGSSIAYGPRLPLSLINDASAPHDRPEMEHMILAMHQALIIYFYRRVYSMSVMVVQAQVRKTLELIQPCLDMGRFDLDFSVSIGWSTFIAVCEAATPDLQELGLRCLEAVDEHGMFVEYEKPSTIAKAVWERRRKTNDFTLGWPDLMMRTIPSMR